MRTVIRKATLKDTDALLHLAKQVATSFNVENEKSHASFMDVMNMPNAYLRIPVQRDRRFRWNATPHSD
jgi:hypothetical protein